VVINVVGNDFDEAMLHTTTVRGGGYTGLDPMEIYVLD
jgi:hypothetical protein